MLSGQCKSVISHEKKGTLASISENTDYFSARQKQASTATLKQYSLIHGPFHKRIHKANKTISTYSTSWSYNLTKHN